MNLAIKFVDRSTRIDQPGYKIQVAGLYQSTFLYQCSHNASSESILAGQRNGSWQKNIIYFLLHLQTFVR